MISVLSIHIRALIYGQVFGLDKIKVRTGKTIAPRGKAGRLASCARGPAAGARQARRTGLPRLPAAPSPGRRPADAGTFARGARRHAAAVHRADHAEGLSGPVGR